MVSVDGAGAWRVGRGSVTAVLGRWVVVVVACCFVAALARGGRALPERVGYAEPCGALCRSSTSRATLATQRRLIVALHTLVKHHAAGRKLAKAALADLVIAVETYRKVGAVGSLEAQRFYAVASGLGRFGRQDEQVNLIELQVEQGSPERPYGGVILGARRDPFICAEAPRSPLHLAGFGPW